MKKDVQIYPWCGSEMEYGKLATKYPAYFHPHGKKWPLLCTDSAIKKIDGIMLYPPLRDLEWSTTCPQAFACRKCHKIVVPYEE